MLSAYSPEAMTGAIVELARWPRGTFSAHAVRYLGQLGARVSLDSGKVALLTGPSRPMHRNTRAAVEAITGLAHPPAH